MPGYKFEAQSQIFLHQTFYIKKTFDTTTSRDVLEQLMFSYFKSHAYNYSVNDQRALITTKSGTHTTILERRE